MFRHERPKARREERPTTARRRRQRTDRDKRNHATPPPEPRRPGLMPTLWLPLIAATAAGTPTWLLAVGILAGINALNRLISGRDLMENSAMVLIAAAPAAVVAILAFAAARWIAPAFFPEDNR